MELSPEEKQKIYEEEKTRIEAQDKINKEKSEKTYLGCLIFFIIIVIIALLIALFTDWDKVRREQQTEKVRDVLRGR